MKKFSKFKRKFNNYMYDHIGLREGLNFSKGALVAALTALLYAFGFYCFVAPSPLVENHATIYGSSITTGGVGGISQVIWMIFSLCGANVSISTMQSIFYFALNVPIVIFAFFKIGKKFSILTLLNVGLSSLFIWAFSNVEFMNKVSYALDNEVTSYHSARVLFAAISIGLASSIAFRNEISCGGIDVISYYFALRKSTSVGKYATALNSVILLTYFGLTIPHNIYNTPTRDANVDIAFVNLLFSFLYLFSVMLVVDFVNIRNKKVQIQIITSIKDISSVLIANFPHSTTTLSGVGGYSHTEKTVVYMVVSSNEVKRVIDLVRKVDQHAFVTVTSLIQAYGNFFIKPVE